MHQQGIIGDADLPALCLFLHRTRNTLGNDKRFQRHALQFGFCFVNVQSPSEQNTDKTRSSAVDRDIEVTRTDTEVLEKLMNR